MSITDASGAISGSIVRSSIIDGLESVVKLIDSFNRSNGPLTGTEPEENPGGGAWALFNLFEPTSKTLQIVSESLPLDSKTGISISILSATATAGIVTANTNGAHGYSIGDDVCVWGGNEFDYLGVHTITATPLSTSFKYDTGNPGTPASATGTLFSIEVSQLANIIDISGHSAGSFEAKIDYEINADIPNDDGFNLAIVIGDFTTFDFFLLVIDGEPNPQTLSGRVIEFASLTPSFLGNFTMPATSLLSGNLQITFALDQASQEGGVRLELGATTIDFAWSPVNLTGVVDFPKFAIASSGGSPSGPIKANNNLDNLVVSPAATIVPV